jgi:hypothetical protein
MIRTMNTKATESASGPTSQQVARIGASGAPEQLTLLASPSVPLQFRLDERTRRSGLQHVAVLRAQMAAQAEQRRGIGEHKRPERRRAA